MPRTTIESMLSLLQQLSPNALVRAIQASLLLALASCGGVGPSAEDREPIGEQQQAAAWDTGDRPVPKNFLSRYSIYSNNKCCLTGTTGGDGNSSQCTKACGSYPTGLVTADGVAKAADYYIATGEGSLDTFDAWKAYYNFPKRKPAESLDAYRARANVVIYYNLTELGLGRELGCAINGLDAACYVTNYGSVFNDQTNSLAAAVSGQNVRNTVVISYRGFRTTRYAVQFAAFGADGKRINKAQLDNHGARPIPEICMSCHGGHWDPDALGSGSKYGLAQDARFLPLITNTVVFPSTAPYRKADLEPAILSVNNAAWFGRYETLTGRQQDLLNWVYNDTGSGLAFYTATPYQKTSIISPFGWEGHESTYLSGVLPFCDTCHMAADSQHVTRTLNESIAGNFLPPLGTLSRLIARGWQHNVIGDYGFQDGMTTAGYAGWMGIQGYGTNHGDYSGSSWTTNDHSPMPHAESAFGRFWADKTGNLQACNIGGARPPVDCFLVDLGIWPTGSGASTPNVIHPTIPTDVASDRKASAPVHCGQNATEISSTTGTNAGRRLAGSGGTTCVDGCRRAEAYCPGTEGNLTNEYPGARYECNPIAADVGSCVACGALGQPVCTKVGANCDPAWNPNCTVALPCHEGFPAAGFCVHSPATIPTLATSQSSTFDTAEAKRAIDGNGDGNYYNGHVSSTNTGAGQWWKVDLAGVKRTRRIEIATRTDCCKDRLKSMIVESSLNGSTWTPFPGGDFDSSGVGPDNPIVLTPSKPVELRHLRIRLRTGTNALQLTEVRVYGWVPFNVAGGVACSPYSCTDSTGALRCGGGGCGSFPGHGANCCIGTITSSGKHCNGNPGANAPCILP